MTHAADIRAAAPSRTLENAARRPHAVRAGRGRVERFFDALFGWMPAAGDIHRKT
jgi:hypothetical protein